MTQRILESPFGSILLIAQEGCLVYCNWLDEECETKRKKILKDCGCHEELNDKVVLKDAEKQLQEYFRGNRKSFDLPLHIMGTKFQKGVWEELRKIDYGTTLTYKELAGGTGCERGYRAVANACGANPLAIIIPCHRVIASDGRSGGYMGGVHRKKSLLELETK